MRIRHVLAIVIIHTIDYLSVREWSGILYWWFSDVMLYGLLGKATAMLTGNVTVGVFMVMAVIAIKPGIGRCAVDMAKPIFEQTSGRTLVSTFATPLTFAEWTVASMFIGLIGAITRWILGYALLLLLFGSSAIAFGWQFIVLFPLLVISGWTIGLYLSVMTYTIGKKSDPFVRAISNSFIVLCGVFYPVAMLPQPFRFISQQIPLTYIFEGLRAQITTGVSIWPYIIKSIEFNLLYLGIGILLLFFAFKRVKNRGLVSLENK